MSDIWERGLAWAWSNRQAVGEQLSRLYRWFRPAADAPKGGPGILIIGPGGAGKTTLARLLSGERSDPLLDEPWRYDESISEERYALSDAPGVEVVVPPGQANRREAAWADVTADLAAGKYRGVILVVAYGWTNLPGAVSYREQPGYAGNKATFLDAHAEQQREEERAVLRHLRSAMSAAPGKLWLLVVVSKQDLWWPDRRAVGVHYRQGAWRDELAAIRAAKGVTHFRDELAGCSLVISCLTDVAGSLLRTNAAGYDQKRQVEGVRRLVEVLEGLRKWEGG